MGSLDALFFFPLEKREWKRKCVKIALCLRLPKTSQKQRPARGGVGQPTLVFQGYCWDVCETWTILFVMLTLRVLDLIADFNLSSLLYCCYLDLIFLSQICSCQWWGLFMSHRFWDYLTSYDTHVQHDYSVVADTANTCWLIALDAEDGETFPEKRIGGETLFHYRESDLCKTVR